MIDEMGCRVRAVSSLLHSSVSVAFMCVPASFGLETLGRTRTTYLYKIGMLGPLRRHPFPFEAYWCLRRSVTVLIDLLLLYTAAYK